jgi:hypothetical protein
MSKNPSIWKHRKWFADKGELGELILRAKNLPEFEHRVRWLGEGSLMYHLSQFQSPYYGTSGTPKEKELYKEFMEYVLNNNTMGKTYKDLKKQGKHVFDGPEVKQRKHFAPATKTEKPKKGKGSYDRGNAFEEDEQKLGEVPPNPNYKKQDLGEVPMKPDHWNKPKKKSLGKRIADKFVNRSVSGGKKSYDEDEQEKDCWKGYEKKGTKKKGGKTVNNCVKESTDLSKFIEAIMTSDHAEAHKQLKKAVNDKIQKRIAQEIDKPLF